MLGSTSSWLNVSPVEVLVTRACDPNQMEPNYALHLEVADYINTKKANTPREAAMLIARLANHRNPHVAILALALLDTLVQSCGYAFHLQISTKEFLNELVRRFPERPPPFPGPVMSRVLDLIHGWKQGICTESRWKEDLGNIRDMHRLLTFKGYRFREYRRQPSLASASNLKSAEELEEEDREAQSAKLQELIRRGTPRDLVAAQELMKALAGANPDAKPDYRSQALKDLSRLEQKVILLNEMLDNADTERGEKFVSGDVYDQVSSILTTARPKLQKWISDAQSDDPESLDTFLQINDQINTVLNRYEAFKKGDYVTSSNPIPAELASGPSAQSQSLIDLDDNTPAQTGGGMDDLASLFASIPPLGTSTSSGPNLNQSTAGMFSPSPMMAANQRSSNSNASPAAVWSGASSKPSGSLSPTQQQQHHQQMGSIALPGTPPINNPTAPGNMSSLTPQRPSGSASRPTVSAGQGQSQTSQGKDPFADLVGLF